MLGARDAEKIHNLLRNTSLMQGSLPCRHL